MSSSADPINNPPTTGAGNVARMVDRLSMHIPNAPGGAPKKPPKPNNNNHRTAHVRFSYVAQQEDELSLEEDDVIEVLEDVEDGWARGRLKDKVGLFPTNFVSFSNTSTTNSTSYASSRINNEDVRKRSRDEPPQQQQQQTNGKIQAERTASSGSTVLPSSFKASVRKSTTTISTTAAPSTSNTTPKSNASKEIAKVLYEYKSAQPDELELREGDVITVLTRKCADEGWCEGELNGRRGLFPENFVKFVAAPSPVPTAASSVQSTGPTPSRMTSSVAGTAVVPPPVLPAKPLKSAAITKKEVPIETPAATGPPTTTASSAPTPTATTTTASSTISTEKQPTTTTATPLAAAVASPPSTNQHTTLEERKSMIAGLQSKLFPQGKMPPYKPTYQPPSNAFTHANNGAEGQADSTTNEKPTVQMRHSVVDPTKLPTAQSTRDSEPPTSDDSDEPRQLESLTKFRPKQAGKRPPSSHIRLSRLPNGRDELPSTPPLTPPSTAAPTPPVPSAPPAQIESSSVAVSTGPATTSFPAADSRPSGQQSSPNTTTTAAAREIARELNAIGVAVANKNSSSPTGTNMGQRPSRNHSAGSTHSNSHFHVGPKLSDADTPAATISGGVSMITRAEFDEFRADVFKRLARLEERLLKNDPTEPSELHHL